MGGCDFVTERFRRRITKVKLLLELVLRTEARVWAHCESGYAPHKAFPSGIGRLILAVLRQQKELGETGLRRQTEIKVLDRATYCQNCHQPLETEDEEHNED